jgi:cytochrome c biogenesis protein CcmG, thiol:disulfide interchange protein DsbE
MKHITSLFLLLCLSLSAGDLSGRLAPSFALPDSSLKYHDILDYRGKVLVLEIMKTDCPHCQALAGTLEKVKAKYGDNVNILSVVNPPDSQTTVAQFIQKYKVGYPILFDCGQTSAAYFKVTPQRPTVSLPHIFLIDAQGQVREDFGFTTPNPAVLEGPGLFAAIDKIMGGSGKK